jgi:hypothetical protein
MEILNKLNKIEKDQVSVQDIIKKISERPPTPEPKPIVV